MRTRKGREIRLGRILAVTTVIALAAFWIVIFKYSIFDTPEKRNVIGDKQWTSFAEDVCAIVEADRVKLADLSHIDGTPAELNKRANLVDLATDGLEEMIRTLESRQPADAKGQALVPMWIADYKSYIENRREYTTELRAGKNATFSELGVEGIPITEKIGAFAADNEMSSCIPPTDVAG